MHESSDNLANINHFQSLLDMGLSLNFNLDIMNKVDCVELGHKLSRFHESSFSCCLT